MDTYEPLNLVQLSDQHISGSYTLGPATTFAAPSVSRIVEENGTKSRRVYAVIEQSPGVRGEDHGRTVWMWDDKRASENSGGTQEKKSSITVRLSLAPSLGTTSYLVQFLGFPKGVTDLCI